MRYQIARCGFCCALTCVFFSAALADHTDAPLDAAHAPRCEVLWPSEHSRDAYRAETWPGGVVPFVFDDNVNAGNRLRMEGAMGELMGVCGVRFVPRTDEADYLVIMSSTGNASYVGRIGGPQDVYISSWTLSHVIIHELMHALGAFHEHTRPDRDQFVRINYENIIPAAPFLRQFDLEENAETIGPYDFESVMHYSQYAFSSGPGIGLQTITVLPPNAHYQDLIGELDRMSDGDIAGLVARYGAPLRSDFTGDGLVDEVDLAILVAAWDTPDIDLDGDGVCAASDLAYLLAEWSN